jgi:hypothetical protein
MTNSIEQAMKAASDIANQQAAVAANAVAVIPAAALQGRAITDADMLGGAVVDHFLKTSDTEQVAMGTTKGWFNSITVSLDLAQVSRGFSVCYGMPYVYERTTNMATTDKGLSWEDAKVRAAKHGKRPYDSWELPMILLEDTGEVEAGAVIGYTTTWSSFNSPHGFKAVYLAAKERFGDHAVIKMTVGAKAIDKGGKKYKDPTFTLVGEIVQE